MNPYHTFYTVKDIIDVVTSENVDRLCKDLTLWLYSMAKCKSMGNEISCDNLKWIDDGVFESTAVIHDMDSDCVIKIKNGFKETI